MVEYTVVRACGANGVNWKKNAPTNLLEEPYILRGGVIINAADILEP